MLVTPSKKLPQQLRLGLLGDLVTIDHSLANYDTSNWEASSTARSTAILAAPATNRRLPRGVASPRLQVQCRLQIDIAAGSGIPAARTGVASVRARGRRGPARDWRETQTCKTVIRATITEKYLTKTTTSGEIEWVVGLPSSTTECKSSWLAGKGGQKS